MQKRDQKCVFVCVCGCVSCVLFRSCHSRNEIYRKLFFVDVKQMSFFLRDYCGQLGCQSGDAVVLVQTVYLARKKIQLDFIVAVSKRGASSLYTSRAG